MSNFWRYHKAQLKKNSKIFPTIMFMTLLLLAGIGLFTIIFLRGNANDDAAKKFQVGIVGDTTDKYLTMGITAAQNLDSSRFMLDFLFVEEEEAIELLRKGELSAYLIIPDGFMDSVMVGENKRIQFVTSEGTVDITTILLNEIAQIISKMITESQAAGSALFHVMLDNDLQDQYHAYGEQLDITIAMLILSRTDIYEIETVRGKDQISIASYYVCGILLFFLLIWGMNASSVLAEKNQAMQILLKSRGQSVFSQVFAEYLAYFVLMAVSMFVITGIAWGGMKLTGYQLAEWDYAESEIIFGFYLRLIPVFLLVAAVQFLLYECTKDCISGILLQFICAISLSYISGCFYPVSFFPKVVQGLNDVLPTGIAMQYMCNSVLEEEILVDGMKLIGYAAVFVIIASFIRRTRLQRADKD